MLPNPSRFSLLICQVAIAAVGVTVLAIAPPAQGKMMLVPMTEEAASALPLLAAGRGALIIGGGPFAGSLVVDGRRETLMAAGWNHAILVTAAPVTGCAERKAAA